MDLGRVRLNRFDRFFGELPDRHGDRAQCHPLSNLLAMALCGSICGAGDCESLEVFCALRAAFFATFLDLSDVTPSAETFRRVLSLFDPHAFAVAFGQWTHAFRDELACATVAPDGASLRVAAALPAREGLFRGTQATLTRAQLIIRRAPDADTGAMLQLLQSFDLRGATVSAAAAHGGAAVAHACRCTGADCIIALDGHRAAPRLHELFANAPPHEVQALAFDDEAYGRVERRIIRALSLPRAPFASAPLQLSFATAIEVAHSRSIDDRVRLERSYYVTSLPAKPQLIARRLRPAWNRADLEIAVNEARPPDPFAAQNLACIGRTARVLLAREPTEARSLVTRRRRAAWSHDYLLRVLTANDGEP